MKNSITGLSRSSGQRGASFKRIPVAQACVLMMITLGGAAQAQQAEATTELSKVTVTGIRHGIEDAISTKKNATSIVEAISSEDVGKLPDNTVAESISRLTGVATQRSKANGKATEVSVRGMSPAFNGSLLNGREQASTSDARSPEFDLFPSELTSSVVVYKTPDAGLVGQGLASTIDLRTLRPLDFGKRTVALSARTESIGDGSGSDLGAGHRKSLLYVDQFADRTLGIAFGYTSFKEDNGGELKFDSWGGWAPTVDNNGTPVQVPGGFLADTMRRTSERDSASLTLQYKPNQNFKTTLDVLVSRGAEATKKTGIEGAVAFGTGPYDPNGVLSNATIVNGVATSGTLSNYKGDVRNHMIASTDKLTSLGWNAEWKVSDWRLETDLSQSRGIKNISNFETTAGQPGNTPAAQLASISWTGFNGNNFADVKYKPSANFADRNFAVLTDVDGWGGGVNSPQAGYVSLPTIDDTVNSARFTVHKDMEWGPIVRSHFGINLTKRDKSRTGQEGRLSVNGADGYASMKVPGTETAMAGASGIEVVSFDPTGSLGSIYGINRWVDPTVLARDWSVSEKVTTAYLMGDLDGTLMSLPYTGNIGLQVVSTNQSSAGNQVDLAHCTGITVATCPYSVRTGGVDYTDVLPSLNVAFDLGSDRVLRFGAGKQITRANLDNMKASLDFGVQNATAVAPALTGFAGNPELKPYSATSLDVSFEKYFAKHGYVSVAAFYKKLDSYIINAPRQFDFKAYTSPTTPLPQSGPYKGSTVGFLTSPENGQDGNLKGFEFAINVPFSLLVPALDGFGVVFNHSYTDSSVRLPTSGFVSPTNSPVFQGQVSEIGLPGLSKQVSSLRLYYENRGVQLAWAAHRRSDFIGQIQDYRSDSQFTFIKGETIVDLQAGYEFKGGALKGLSVFLQAHNWNNAAFQEYTSDPDVITNSVLYGRTYSAGLNYKF